MIGSRAERGETSLAPPFFIFSHRGRLAQTAAPDRSYPCEGDAFPNDRSRTPNVHGGVNGY